jgi:hypothetical protein
MTNLQAITGSFDFHVDPSHYGFQWSEAMYINVEYSALKRDGEVVASVYKISAAPWLIGSINIRGNWMAVDKEITAAAQDHAAKEFGRNGHVDETILSALAPHI